MGISFSFYFGFFGVEFVKFIGVRFLGEDWCFFKF